MSRSVLAAPIEREVLVFRASLLGILSALLLAPASASAVAAEGTIAFVSQRDGNLEIYTMRPDGSGQTNISANPALDQHPAISPDGSKIAFTSDRDGNTEIYVMGIDGSNPTRLTTHVSNDEHPSWSPDGGRIAFTSYREGNADIMVMNADGTQQLNITNDPSTDQAPDWSPSGGSIAFNSDRDGTHEIYRMTTQGLNLGQLTDNGGGVANINPSWSPTGESISFSSTRDGNFEIYTMFSLTGSGETRLTHTTGLAFEVTSNYGPDGRIVFDTTRDAGNSEIYLMQPDGTLQTNISNHPAGEMEPDWSAGAQTKTPKELSLKSKPKKKVQRGKKVLLTATIAPCGHHAGMEVTFMRKKKGGYAPFATKATGAECVAKVKRKTFQNTKFRATVAEDTDHLAAISNQVIVKVVG